MIKEKIEDTSIQYFYSKDFKWLSAFRSEEFQGHPRPGSIYRGMYNESTKNTKIIISENPWVAIVINDFIKGEEYEGEITPVTLKNILDLNLAESELDKVIKWQERDHKDLKRAYNPPTGEQMAMATLAQAMHQQATEEQADINKAVSLLSALRITDTLGFEIVLELIDAIGAESMTEDPSRGIALDPRLSTGLNVSRSLNSLCRYIGENRRTNFDRNDLIEAFLGIVNELKAIELE